MSKKDFSIQRYADIENKKGLILRKAIAWQKVMCYETDPKPGIKDYYLQRDAMETRVFNELFEAVESYRELTKKKSTMVIPI